MASLLLLLTACWSSGPREFAQDRPNLVVILADDMGFSDLGSYGGEIETPALDRLAEEGVRFSQFYNNARCCPTRAALLTGVYPHQAGVGHMMSDLGSPGYRGDLGEDTVTIAEALSAAGYVSYLSGKWHVTTQVGHWSGNEQLTSKHNWPLQRGFDRFYGTIHGAGSFYDPISLTRGNEPIEPDSDSYYYTHAISEHAVRFVEEHQEMASGRPFFLYVSHTAPHWPLHALEADIAKYEGRYSMGWDAVRESRHRRLVELGLLADDWTMSQRPEEVPAWSEVGSAERAWYERAMEVYAAQVDSMDQGIGDLLDALERTDQRDNTLVLFLADNGGCAEVVTAEWRGMHFPKVGRNGKPVAQGNETGAMPGPEEVYQSYGPHWAHASNTPFRLYKHWVHEGGIASPLVVSWPARVRSPGRVVHDVGHVVDVLATALDVAGVPYPESRDGSPLVSLQGQSLAPVLFEQPLPTRPLFWEHEGNRAVRDGDLKAVARYPGEWELYDLATDRTETDDLAERRSADLIRLVELYDEWASRSRVEEWGALRERARERRARERQERARAAPEAPASDG